MKFPNFTFEGGQSKNPTVGEFFLWLLRGHICVSFDNARTLNCCTLRRSKDICIAINERMP